MESTKKYRIILVALNANLASFALGTCVGWSSPVIPKLRDNTYDSPLDTGITTVEEGWINSLITIGAFVASLMAGPVAGRLGLKWTLLSTSLFLVASYILLMIGGRVWIIYVGRCIQGIGGGLIATTIPMYVGEIATDDCRGAVGSLMTLFVIGGIIYAYAIGPYVSYMTLQWCCIVIPLIFLGTFFFMPESPYFFAIKGRREDGIRSLKFLRGQTAEAVEDEMTQIQISVDEAMSNKGSLIDIFRRRGYRKALLICSGLLSFQQLSGTTAVTTNSQSIFNSAKSSLDPAVATIILGVVQLVANLFTPFVIERTGRKVILIISAIGMCLALLALGTFFYIQAFGNATNLRWLPVPALILFNLFYSFGFGPIPWAMLGEMFPSNIKSIATSIASSNSWLMGFIVTRWFPELNDLGSYYAFWVFSVLCALALLFVLFVMIETKGLSLKKIQEKLHGVE